MTSITPLAIDGMLPAFPQIGETFQVFTAEKIQLILALFFQGTAFGLVIFGPLSDVFGRKPPIYWGIGIFLLGSILCGYANSFEWFLAGRFLQGLGCAAPRIVSIALIRDEHKGTSMAKITSLVMTIFILVPAVAPAMGQAVLLFASWREIFLVLFLVGFVVLIWFALRQHETLSHKNRQVLTWKYFMYGFTETLRRRSTVVCITASGLLFGIIIGYLGAVQSLFSEVFQVNKDFPMYFAILALSIGVASFLNSKLVMALGMRRLINIAFFNIIVLSSGFALYLVCFLSGHPKLIYFMLYLSATFSMIGFLFGNLSALAMEPLGHVAGIGSAIGGFIQTSIAVIVGINLGKYFHGTVLPLVLSFAIMSAICLLILNLPTIQKKAPIK